MNKPFKVEYAILNSSNPQTRYSVHQDFKKAEVSLKRAARQPGGSQYSWRIRNITTGEVWCWIGGTLILDLLRAEVKP